MSLQISDFISIQEESKKYIADNSPTTGANAIYYLHFSSGNTSSNSIETRVKIPNEMTKSVFEQTDKGENLTFFENADDFLNSLNA